MIATHIHELDFTKYFMNNKKIVYVCTSFVVCDKCPWFCFSFLNFWKLVELWNCVLVLFCQISRKFILWFFLFCCNIILFVLLNQNSLEGSLFWFFLCFLSFLFCYDILFPCFLEFKKLEGLFLKILFSFPLCYWFIDLNNPMTNWTSLEA